MEAQPDRDAGAVIRAAADPGTESPALGNDRPKEVLGQPVRYFWKPMLRVGEYHHPNPRYGVIRFTREDLTEVDRGTRQWMKDGGRPFVPASHGGYDASNNLGWITQTKFDGDTLWGLHALIGADAHLAAARNESSACIRREFKAGNGTVYKAVLEHNALCPDPVAMGLGGFVALSRETAAGDGAASETLVPVFTMAAERPDEETIRSTCMFSAEQLTEVRGLLGHPDATETEAFSGLVDALRTARQDAGASRGAVRELQIQLSHATEERDAACRARDSARVELSRSPGAPVVDPDALADRAEACLARIDLAVERGDMPPFVADRLRKAITPEAKRPDAVLLSRASDGGPRPIDLVLSLFSGAGLGTAIGEQSGPQVLPLSRRTPGEDDYAGGYDPDFIRRWAERVSPVPINGNGR